MYTNKKPLYYGSVNKNSNNFYVYCIKNSRKVPNRHAFPPTKPPWVLYETGFRYPFEFFMQVVSGGNEKAPT